MSRSDDLQKMQTAFSLHQGGKFKEAANLCRQLIKRNSNNFDALHFLGVIEAGIGNFEQAKSLMARSLSLQPSNIIFIKNYATVLFQMGDYKSALQSCQTGLQRDNRNVSLLYISASSLAKLNQLQESLIQLDKLLSLQPSDVVAINDRGLVLARLRQYDAALAAFEKVLIFNLQYAEAHLNKGNIYSQLERYDEAITAYDKALALRPDLANAWLGRGNVFTELRRYDEASAAYDKALALKPNSAEAWNGRGNIFSKIKRYDEALSAYDKALTLMPDLAEAWLSRGNVFGELKRHGDALSAFDKALALRPDLANAWLGRGNVFTELGRYDEASTAYDRALALKPDSAEAWNGCGNVFSKIKRHDDAFAAYNKALALKPSMAGAWLGRGNVLNEFKRYDEALSAYDKALTLMPDLAEAWLGRGNVFSELKRYDEAFSAYDKALKLRPNLPEAESLRLHTKIHLCNWSNYETECAHLVSSVRNENTNASPFEFIAIPSSPDDQLQCAKLWIAANYPANDKLQKISNRIKNKKIRIGYFSADFRNHPLAHLMAGVFEHHDRENYEVYGFSFLSIVGDKMQQRVGEAFHQFIDVQYRTDFDVAVLAREFEIDIAIDLMGLTKFNRTNIFAMRAAPIQVNYLGYMGTMGANFIDYLIADSTLVPASDQQHFSEKIAYLPNSFQPNDRERRIADKIFTRAEVGLPQEGFVFCCFNSNYKITPDVYDIWMRILKQVDGSALWLVAESPAVASNLRSEATTRGVDAERLIFAPRVPLPEHQARLRLADLFLDTLPYNAGATASDALWAELPVLTRIGDTLAGRMAASLLNAIGIPELITTTSQEYEALAIMLATHPDKLADIKQKLVRNRLISPLFDTKRFTQHIEAAYTAMYERHRAGLSPDHIFISD
jgi:protein O-GlcNAc transferase